MDHEKRHHVYHFNINKLPPLQNAIYEHNSEVIQYLVENKFGIAFVDKNKDVILCEDEKDLPIQLIYIDNGETSKSDPKINAGFEYKIGSQSHWVIAELPKLNNVRLTCIVHKLKSGDIQNNPKILLPIVECRSPRPLFAAFRDLIEMDAKLEGNYHLRDFICKHGSEQVVIEYITKSRDTLFTDINKFLSMLKSAIDNPKVLGYLLKALTENESKDDFNQDYAPLISACLSTCLSLSVESEDINALNILMQHGCKINYLYGDKEDSLLQLTLRKSGKAEFIKSILQTISKNKNIHHMKDENSNMVPLIDWKNTEQHTALHICIQKSSLENKVILAQLLLHNARINYTDTIETDTILHMIVKENKESILADMILEKLKSIEDTELTHIGETPFLDAKNKAGKTAIHVCIELENEDILKTLLNFDHDRLSRDPTGNTALHLAVNTQKIEFVKHIADENTQRNIITAENNQGYTPLHCAIDLAESSIADHLLKIGAIFSITDYNKQNILHHAIKLPKDDSRKMIEYICKYEEDKSTEQSITKMVDRNKCCPLHLAVLLQNLEAVNSLLGYDPSVLNKLDKSKRSVLHLAILSKQDDETKSLILQSILDKIKYLENNSVEEHWLCNRVIDYQDSLGKSALHYCISLNNADALKKLLKYNPKLGLKDLHGNTPLHQAVLNHEHSSLLQPLLDSINGKDEYQYSFNSKYFRPLQLAILKNNLPAIEILINTTNRIQLTYQSINGIQTLCDGIGLSSLSFISVNSFCYTGYAVKYNNKEYWIVTRFPGLDDTYRFEQSICNPFNESNIEDVLVSILKCKSQDPLRAVFENKLLFKEQLLNNGLYMSQFVSQHATKEVMAYYLTEHDATLYTFPNSGRSMIESSICNPQLETIALLLNIIQTDDPKVKECLHNSLEISLENEENYAMSLLLDFNSILNDIYEAREDTLLHMIVYKNKQPSFLTCLLDKVKSLEEKNPRSTHINNTPLLDVKNYYSKTPLHLAIENKNMKNLEKLLMYEPSLEICDDYGDTALHYAVFSENLPIVEKIVAKIQELKRPEIMEIGNTLGSTPLHLAVFLGNVEITLFLINQGCNFFAKDLKGQTMLHYAVSIPRNDPTSEPMVECILQHDKSGFNYTILRSKDIKEHSPLQTAVIEDQWKVVDQLIEATKYGETHFDTSWIEDRVICYQDCEMKTALHLSIQYRNIYALNALLNTDPCLLLKDIDGNTILHTATLNPSDEVSIRTILDSIKDRFRFQIEEYLYGATNTENLTPLQFAIKNGHFSAVKALVKEFNTSIAYESPQDAITLNFNVKLPLSFYHTIHHSKKEFYIGYSFVPSGGSGCDEVFVICRLPLRFEILSQTKISNRGEMGEISIDQGEKYENLLEQIFRSQTDEPLQAFHYLSNLTTAANLSNKSTLMHFAAQYGTHQVIKYIINQLEFDYKTTDGDGNGIFHRAIHNDIDNVQFLLEVLGDLSEIINIENRSGLRPLDFALDKDKIDVFLRYILLEYQAVLNYYDPTCNTLIHKIVLKNCETTSYLNELLDNIKLREEVSPESTFINGIPLIDCYSLASQERYTALHFSIITGNITALEILFGFSANLSLPTLHHGFSTVHLAIIYRQSELVYLSTVLEMCIQKNPMLFNLKDTRGYLWPILESTCVEKGSGPLVLARAIGNTDSHLYSNAGWIWQISFGSLDLRTCGYSPLHLAISYGIYGCVNYMLNGLNIPDQGCISASYEQLYVRDPEGFTALHYATFLDSIEANNIIEMLFAAESSRNISGKSILTQRCNKGETPLHTAISKGRYFEITQSNQSIVLSILLKILEYAHNLNPDSISYLDGHNRSILHHAVITKNDVIFSAVLNELETKKGQLNRIGDLLLNLQDYDGKTALHLTVEYDFYFAFEKLMNYSPELQLRDKVKQWTVLHSIIGNSRDQKFLNSKLCENLVKQFVKIWKKDSSLLDIMDYNGLTGLHLAIRDARWNFVQTLFELGAKLSVELGETGCDTYTVGASGEKGNLLLGKTENKDHIQINEYIVAYKVGDRYLVSTLPQLEDTKFLGKNDIEFEKFSEDECESILIHCFASKCPELVQKLIDENKMNFTAKMGIMHLAAQYASIPVMKFLCEEKQPDFDYESVNNYGNTLIHCGVKNIVENLTTLEYLLNKTETFENTRKKEEGTQKILKIRNYKNQSALQISINSGKYTFFIALIKHGADVEETNQDGNGILHILMQNPSKKENEPFQSIRELIENMKMDKDISGKLIDLLNLGNSKGHTALQIAIIDSNKQLVKLLIDNMASLSVIQKSSGNTIVHLATIYKKPESSMELFETVITAVKNHDKEKTYDSILDRRNSDSFTPLHISVRDKQEVFMTKLLLDAGVPLEKYDRDGNTALHIATRNADVETVKVIMPHLIKKGREYRLADRGWEYMKELARENKKKEIPVCIPTKVPILNCMLQAWKHSYNVPFGEGRRGLLIHLAVFEENQGLVQEIINAIKEIEKHHDKEFGNLVGNILSTRDTEDQTPLHIAAETGNESIGAKLIEAGADIQLNSSRGTSFEVAMQRDHTKFAISLVEKGAYINKYLNLLAYDTISNKYIEENFLKTYPRQKNKRVNLDRRISSADCTVIHYAAKQSSVSRIDLLLRYGIALAASDRDGKRALHYAIQYRDDSDVMAYEVMEFLLDQATKKDEFNKDPPNRLTYVEALMHRDLDGVTPVMLAASLDRIQFFKLLTTDNYEYLLETFDTCDPNENNVIHYLAKYKSIETAMYIVPYIKKTRIDLFTHIMNGRNVDGHSPIDLARKRGQQEMVDLFVDLCDLEYFEACPDVVHRMVNNGDYENFSKVLAKTVIKDSQNVQIDTKLMDSNEEGDYPNFRFFNFHLAPLWHKLYRSNDMKYKYHPVLKFLIEEKLSIYRWWFMSLFFLYFIFFYIPLSLALFFASSKCDSELFLYDSDRDRFRFCLESYILIVTWFFIINELLEIEAKWRYLQNLFFTSCELDYRRKRQVQYYGNRESNKITRSIQKVVRRVFYEIPVKIHKLIYDIDRKSDFLPRAVYRHFKETYNVIDIFSVFFLILLFCLRLMLAINPIWSALHWTCSALTFTFFTFRFYKYTKMFPSLGIYIETLSNVLSTDVPRFSLVIIILLISYIGSIQLVARTYCTDGGQCSFSSWFRDDSLPFSPLTTPFLSGLLFIIDGGPGNYEGSFREVPFIFSVFYLVFAFCIIVVLLNVFIAQLSQTYANIYANKELLDFKAELALDYETQSSILFKLFSPLRRPLKRIMVESIIIPLEAWKSYYTSYNHRLSNSAAAAAAAADNDDNLKKEQSHSLSLLTNSINEIKTRMGDRLEKRLNELIPQNKTQRVNDETPKAPEDERDQEESGNKDIMKSFQQLREEFVECKDNQKKILIKLDKIL